MSKNKLIPHSVFLRRWPWSVWVAVAAMAVAVAFRPIVAQAAELRLHSQCCVRGPLVTLGDVAEVCAADRQDAKSLAAVELFPTPVPGRTRFLRVREVQELLLLRGLNLTEHRFSGSSRVAISAADEPPPPPPAKEPRMSTLAVREANQRIARAVLEYLGKQDSDSRTATVEVELDESRAKLVSAAGDAISIRGGSPPWTGSQRFTVTVELPEGPVQFAVEARLAQSATVVVTTRPLSRGAVVRAADVELQHQASGEEQADLCRSLDEVVGKQITRSIGSGEVIRPSALRQPLMVRRSEVVTVHARRPGIRIRTAARAHDDGSLGDLIAVESLTNRETFFARVKGIREVEVCARTQAAGDRQQAADSSQ